MAEWADHVALSESSLARLVAKQTGLTFGRWRQQLHLIVAIRELASGASVQRVSADLGYESVTAFITMFKKALGKPPANISALSRRRLRHARPLIKRLIRRTFDARLRCGLIFQDQSQTTQASEWLLPPDDQMIMDSDATAGSPSR